MKWKDKYNELIGLLYIPIIIDMEINFICGATTNNNKR